MRKIIIFLLPVVLALFSCHSSQLGKNLVEIDSLLEVRDNETAFKMLQEIKHENFSKDESAYYNLLLTIAQYQLYIPISSDSLINRCIETFSANGDNKKLTRAYYFRGCIKNESMGNIVEAILDEKKAEAIAEKTGDKAMLLKVDAMLSHMNYSSGNSDIAKRYAWKVIAQAEKQDAKRWIGFAYQMLDVIYNKLGMKDSSDYYCLESEKYVEYQNENEKYAYYRNIANAYLSRKDLKNAEKYYMLSLEKKEDVETYGALAEFYAALNRDQEADDCWKKSLNGSNTYLRYLNLKKYSDWLNKKGRYSEALKYAHESIAVNDSIAKGGTESLQARDVQEKYDLEEQSSSYNKKRAKIMTIVAIVLLICVVVLILLFRSHRHIADIEARLQENETKRHEQMALIEKLKSEGKEQSSQAKALMRELDILNADYNDALHKGEQCYNFIKDNGNTSTWTKAEFVYFLEYYKRLRPEFEPNAGEKYASLTHTQRFLLCLQDMGLNDTEICDVLCMTKGALRTARSRIRSRLG